MGSCSFYASQEDQLYYCNGRSTVLLEDQLYHWKTNCYVGRSTVLLENWLHYWKINCDAGRSMVLLEDQLYWRQSTGLDRNYRSRKITARWRLHKYVGAEYGAFSFTWYLYPMCNTDVRLSVCGQNRVCSVSSTKFAGFISYLHILSTNFRWCVACKVYVKIKKFVFFWLRIQCESIEWVIMRRRGVSSERRRSSCSSFGTGWFYPFSSETHKHMVK